MQVIVRKKQKIDCSGITHVITICWNETYRGIVNDKILNNMYNNEDERTLKAINKFDENNNHEFVLLVDNEIVGYMNVGRSDDEELENCGEIHALYIINKYHGNGFGKKLFNEGINELKNMGFDKMIIGCLEENKSNDFYKHIGGKFIKKRVFKKLNLIENVYYFDL